jgi:hypothetical protein
VNVTGWSRGLEVTADGEGIVSHAGLALLRGLADKAGLTAGLSRALAGARSWRGTASCPGCGSRTRPCTR